MIWKLIIMYCCPVFDHPFLNLEEKCLELWQDGSASKKRKKVWNFFYKRFKFNCCSLHICCRNLLCRVITFCLEISFALFYSLIQIYICNFFCSHSIPFIVYQQAQFVTGLYIRHLINPQYLSLYFFGLRFITPAYNLF